MATNTYSGNVTGPITVANGDEADFNAATVTSGGNGVTGQGTITVKLVGSTIMSTDRGITDDASGLLTVSVDSNSSITGKDGVGSSFAPIALTNAGVIQTNQSGFSGVAISTNSNGSTVVNSGTISGGGAGDYAINANGTAVVTNSGVITTGTFGALRFSDRGATLNLSDGATAGVINGGIVTDGALTVSNNGVANYTLSSVVSGGGSLQKMDAGVLTLSAANTYTGGTGLGVASGTVVANHASSSGVIDALGSGTVTLAGGTLSLGVVGTVSNPLRDTGGGAITGAGGTLAGGLSGGGSIAYSANLTLTGADTRTGAFQTFVGSGFTVTAAGATTVAAASDLAVLGTVSLATAETYTVNGLSGSGIVQAAGPGATTLIAATDAFGPFSGVLRDGPAAGGASTLALTKVGAGLVTLSGADTYTGATTVNGGVLAVDGSLTSVVTVATGATVRGTGTDSAAVRLNGGTFAPGELTGTFTAAGGLSFAAGSTFAETITGAGANGRAQVTGTVDLANATLTVNYTGAAAGAGQLTVLTAGAVTGHFANATTDGAMVLSNGHSFRVNYTATSVTLTDVTAPPSLAGVPAAQQVADNATVKPFGSVQVSDSTNGAADTATITVMANGVASDADGVLTGLGVAHTGAGTYTVAAGTAAVLQQELQGAVFTPTANQVAPGGTVATSFFASVNNGAGSAGASTTVTATSVQDVPAIAGAMGGQTVGDTGTLRPFTTVTVTDPDVGQIETVTVTFNGANGALSGGGFAGGNGVYTVVVPASSTSGAAAAQAQADLRAALFTPVAGAIGAAPTPTTFTISVNDSQQTATDATTTVSTTHTANTAPVLGGLQTGQATNDKTAVQPFANATVTDPDPQSETVTVTLSNAANGALSGGGFAAVAGAAGTYQMVAPDAATAQADLRALVFTPTMNQVAPGQAVTTGFTVQVSDTVTTVSNTQTSEVVTSVNDGPVLGGLQATATAPSAGSVVLQPTLTITDLDMNPSALDAQVAITSGFVAGDRLTVAAAAGVTAAYNAATGVLTLTGTASDATYQQALRTITYLHDGTTDPGTRTITFSVTDDQAATTRMSETVSVAGFTQPTTGGGTTGSVPTNLDAQQNFTIQFDNLTRAGPNDAAFLTPTSPLYAQAQAEKGIAAQLDSGLISLADAQNALYHLVDGTTSVAEISYAFFTGKTPTAAGLNYLVHSDANATDLNDPYSAQFTTENRYINFAVNLATGAGAGAAAFQAAYGSLSLTDATTTAYAAIFGITPTADKIAAILNAQVSNGLGGTETRAQYFADITGGTAAAQKAAAIGFLLSDSVKEGFGAYQQADLHFLADLAHGSAAFNVDLLAAYSQVPTLVGQPVADSSLRG